MSKEKELEERIEFYQQMQEKQSELIKILSQDGSASKEILEANKAIHNALNQAISSVKIDIQLIKRMKCI